MAAKPTATETHRKVDREKLHIEVPRIHRIDTTQALRSLRVFAVFVIYIHTPRRATTTATSAGIFVYVFHATRCIHCALGKAETAQLMKRKSKRRKIGMRSRSCLSLKSLNQQYHRHRLDRQCRKTMKRPSAGTVFPHSQVCCAVFLRLANAVRLERTLNSLLPPLLSLSPPSESVLFTKSVIKFKCRIFIRLFISFLSSLAFVLSLFKSKSGGENIQNEFHALTFSSPKRTFFPILES
jgi:hypothetical protein